MDISALVSKLAPLLFGEYQVPDEPFPFKPRSLTERELSREDVYLGRSPKLGRTVALVGIARLCFWLEREFDPATEVFVERPRQLELYEGRTVELDFWSRSSGGTERFWAMVGTDDSMISKGGIQPKDAALWDQAAHRAGLSLSFVYESELERRAQRIANYMRILPHVQAARRVNNLPTIAGRVKELFAGALHSLSFLQIEGTLSGLHAQAVRMATCTLIHTGWLTFPQDLPLSGNTCLIREAR